jgi:hypothetical protein
VGLWVLGHLSSMRERYLLTLKASDYEGRVTKDIRALRKERGLDKDQEWDIWRDGCEGGE